MKDVMIDLETFGTNADACIVQVGAAYFNRYTGEIGKTMRLNIDPLSSTHFGGEIDANTVVFWLKQSEDARKSIVAEPQSEFLEAMAFTAAFLADADNIWSHATFDFVILNGGIQRSTMKRSGLPFRKSRDIRTLIELADINPMDFDRVGTHHDALDDCLFQIKYCVAALNKIKLARNL